MKLIYLVLPFILIILICGNLLCINAFISGEKYFTYNKDLEGARILIARKKLLDGQLPKYFNIFIAGTSRAMADFSADTLSTVLSTKCKLLRKPRAMNLGNVANNLPLFEHALRGEAKPDLLILEYHPSLFITEQRVPDRSWYKQYHGYLTIIERTVSGYIRGLLHTNDSMHIGSQTAFVLKGIYVDRTLQPRDFFFAHLNNYGYGQVMYADGQVAYRTFLVGPGNEGKLRIWASEYESYKNVTLVGTLREEAWQAFERLVKRLSPPKGLLVVRPPVAPELYQLENEMQGELLRKVLDFLSKNNVPYIDMNPHNYHTSDMSHIDWYDTRRLSEELAEKVGIITRCEIPIMKKQGLGVRHE